MIFNKVQDIHEKTYLPELKMNLIADYTYSTKFTPPK